MKAMASIFAILVVVSLFAWRNQPELAPAGKTPLVWVSDDNPLRQEQIAQFNAIHPDLMLMLDPANSGMEKVIVQSIGGIGPDLFDCRDANQLSAYVKSGIALDLTDEIERMGIHVERDVWRAMLPMAVREGRVYGIPTNVAANGIWINKDLFRKAGVPLPKAPWSWDQFVETAKRLTVRDERGRATQFGFLVDWWNWPHFLATYGASVFSEDGTRCTIDSPEAIQAIQTMTDLVYRHRVTPSPVEDASMQSAGGWGSGTINLFGAKRAAMALGGRWWLANLRKVKGLELGVVESPYGTVRACSSVGRATLINKNSPRRREALRFIEYLASKPYGELINEQADGIAAFRSLSEGPDFRFNPKYPEEDYNLEWRKITEQAVPMTTSPYVNGMVAMRFIEQQLDLVRIGAKSPRAALKQAAREVDAEIQKNLRSDPALRARWLEAAGKRR